MYMHLPGSFRHPEIRPWRFGCVVTVGRDQTTQCGSLIVLGQDQNVSCLAFIWSGQIFSEYLNELKIRQSSHIIESKELYDPKIQELTSRFWKIYLSRTDDDEYIIRPVAIFLCWAPLFFRSAIVLIFGLPIVRKNEEQSDILMAELEIY